MSVETFQNSMPLEALKKPSILRIARKAGVKRMSADAYNKVRAVYESALTQVIEGATEHMMRMRKRKTLSLADIQAALRPFNLNVYPGNEPIERFPFAKAPFIRDVKQIGNTITTPFRVGSDAITGLMSFMNGYVLRYLRSSAGLKSHSDQQTVGARDIENVYRICRDLPTNLHTPTDNLVPPAPRRPPKKKKKKAKKKKKKTAPRRAIPPLEDPSQTEAYGSEDSSIY